MAHRPDIQKVSDGSLRRTLCNSDKLYMLNGKCDTLRYYYNKYFLVCQWLLIMSAQSGRNVGDKVILVIYCNTNKLVHTRDTSLTNEIAVNIGESNTVLLRSYSVCVVLKGSCELKLPLNSLPHLSLIVNIKTRPPKLSGKNHFL